MHTIQYALVGCNSRFVAHTERMTDEEIRHRVCLLGASDWQYGRIERFNRCPECEVWTTHLGELRTNLDCPAVQAALHIRGTDATP